MKKQKRSPKVAPEGEHGERRVKRRKDGTLSRKVKICILEETQLLEMKERRGSRAFLIIVPVRPSSTTSRLLDSDEAAPSFSRRSFMT
jgi:hypothetical protein